MTGLGVPAAVLVCLVLAGLAVFQVMLALGAPLGHLAWGGQHRVLPSRLRVGSGVSVVVYAVLGALVLVRADLVWQDAPDGFVRPATWVVAAWFLGGVGLNLASRSRPERLVMTPVATVLCLLCVAVALG